MQQLFIYDNSEISISIIEETQKAADKKLAKYVINPTAFSIEESMEIDEIEFS